MADSLSAASAVMSTVSRDLSSKLEYPDPIYREDSGQMRASRMQEASAAQQS